MRWLLLLGFCVLAGAARDQEVLPDLDGMQSLIVLCDDPEQLELVRSYQAVPGFDFLRVTYNAVELLVTAEQVGPFKKFLEAQRIPYMVTDENVREAVVENYVQQQVERRVHNLLRGRLPYVGLSFTYYPDYVEIVEYLKFVASSHSDVAQLIDIGQSFEGRSLKGLKLSSGGAGSSKKPAVFIDAGIHAREWISPATALYIVDQLVANETNRYLLRQVDWYILPLVNPDGYEFTHASSSNRMWRKTRSVTAGSNCRGVDGNRNFDMEWMTTGASLNPCSDVYAGHKPASEPETQAVQNFILAQNGTVKVYLTLHSYGQFILYPWGFTTALPGNEKQLRKLAGECAEAIARSRNTRYTYGTSANHLYPSAGGSDDWAMEKGRADLAYTYELPGGRFGFLLPPSEIRPVGLETFEAIKVVHEHVASTYEV